MTKVFTVKSNILNKSDPRYQRWLSSLKKRPPPWNKGKNKFTDSGVMKISKTFKKKHLDNFSQWRKQQISIGAIISTYPLLNKNSNTAVLTGLVMGDGNITKFPRTEKLTITLGTDKPDLIIFTENLIHSVFHKKPVTLKHGLARAVRVTLYQKHISSRLLIPSSRRRFTKKGIPAWIWKSRKLLTSCLKGLFEAEASLSVHLPTYTYNFAFSNRNRKLLSDVAKALTKLHYHPEVRANAIRLRRKEEVKSFQKLINFRHY